jgi:hypothetical protein
MTSAASSWPRPRLAAHGLSFLTARLFLGVLAVAPITLQAGLPPTDLLLNSTSVREHQPVGTIVGLLKAVDPDASDPHTFALVPGAGADDNAFFAVGNDTLRTAASLDYTNKSQFAIRLRTVDGTGGSVEKRFTITVTPPSFVNGIQDYLATNRSVYYASVAYMDKETLDYFWVWLNCLAAGGSIGLDAPANTPADTATNGVTSVVLSTTEADRILAAKTAHAIWLDKNGLVPWRLGSFSSAQLAGLFDCYTVFDELSATVFSFYYVVDHSPTVAHQYVLQHGLLKGSLLETMQAVLNDLRSDFIHGSVSSGDPDVACTLNTALTLYNSRLYRPMRTTRGGCHSATRILLALLRSVNIPGYETRVGEYYASGHSEAVFPCVGLVLPHGDDLYSRDRTALPVEELLPTFQFFQDNLNTPPCAGSQYRVAMRYEALRGTVYPTPTMLDGVRNPAAYGYASAVAFLTGFAGWDQGLTAAELQQAATTLQTQYNDTRRLTLPTVTSQGYVLNTPEATNYVKDSRVLLKALPKDGYVFRCWTGDVPGGQETANPILVLMNSNRTIQASFTRPPATAVLGRAPSGEALLLFTALSNLSYRVEYSESLCSNCWQTLTNLAAWPVTVVVTNRDAAMRTQVQRFYRIVTQ